MRTANGSHRASLLPITQRRRVSTFSTAFFHSAFAFSAFSASSAAFSASAAAAAAFLAARSSASLATSASSSMLSY